MTEEIVLNSRFSISLPLRVLPLRLKRESILVRPYVCTVCRDTACRVRVLCYRTPSATLLLVPLAPRGTVVPVRVIRANTPVRPYRVVGTHIRIPALFIAQTVETRHDVSGCTRKQRCIDFAQHDKMSLDINKNTRT